MTNGPTLETPPDAGWGFLWSAENWRKDWEEKFREEVDGPARAIDNGLNEAVSAAFSYGTGPNSNIWRQHAEPKPSDWKDVSEAFQKATSHLATAQSELDKHLKSKANETWISRIQTHLKDTMTNMTSLSGDVTEKVKPAIEQVGISSVASHKIIQDVNLDARQKIIDTNTVQDKDKEINGFSWWNGISPVTASYGAAKTALNVGSHLFGDKSKEFSKESGESLAALNKIRDSLPKDGATLDGMKKHVEAIQKSKDTIDKAFKEWVAKVSKESSSGFTLVTPKPKVETKPAPENKVTPTTNTPAGPAKTTPSPTKTKDTDSGKKEDPSSKLKDLLSKVNNPAANNKTPTNSSPSMPNLGNLGSGAKTPTPSAETPVSAKPETGDKDKPKGLTEEDVKKMLQDSKKDEKKPEDTTKKPEPEKKSEPEKKPEGTPVTPVAHATNPQQPQPGKTDTPNPVPQEQAPAGPKADPNTVKIDGKDVKFGDPKTAELARELSTATQGDPKVLSDVAAKLGFNIPPLGQDLGTPVSNGAMENGDIIVNKDNKMFLYIGDGNVIAEDGTIKTLGDTGDWTGAGHGIFRLEDSGSPLPEAPGAAVEGGDKATTPTQGHDAPKPGDSASGTQPQAGVGDTKPESDKGSDPKPADTQTGTPDRPKTSDQPAQSAGSDPGVTTDGTIQQGQKPLDPSSVAGI